jgi:hypothetical protein
MPPKTTSHHPIVSCFDLTPARNRQAKSQPSLAMLKRIPASTALEIHDVIDDFFDRVTVDDLPWCKVHESLPYALFAR